MSRRLEDAFAFSTDWLTARASGTPQVEMEPAVQQLVHVVCPPVWAPVRASLADDQR